MPFVVVYALHAGMILGIAFLGFCMRNIWLDYREAQGKATAQTKLGRFILATMLLLAAIALELFSRHIY